jgi:hypothetical protein
MGEWIFSFTSMVITHLVVDDSVLVYLAHVKIRALMQLIFGSDQKSLGDLRCHMFQRPPALAAIRRVATYLRARKKLTAMTAHS